MVAAGATFLATSAYASWWNDDDYYDRWYDGPWYGGYPGYGWGGYPGYGYWGGYPGHGWGGYPGYRSGRTIIVIPQVNNSGTPRPEPRLPR